MERESKGIEVRRQKRERMMWEEKLGGSKRDFDRRKVGELERMQCIYGSSSRYGCSIAIGSWSNNKEQSVRETLHHPRTHTVLLYHELFHSITSSFPSFYHETTVPRSAAARECMRVVGVSLLMYVDVS